jgi:hypothetical protein
MEFLCKIESLMELRKLMKGKKKNKLNKCLNSEVIV